MYLERLEIQGFKSFAQKTILSFDPGMTSVVGPNGSGKSNIADAIRWVLGEQSLKSLRGKKAEDVIFSGSEAVSGLGMAEVTIVLNNDDGRIPIEFSEVAITRRIYRNGEGEYFINKSKVRLSDITELLAKAGFGQKTYAVIGQGMVDAFLNTTPAERKLLFEEAAGVKHFQLKREQTVRKLESTREHLQRVTDLLAELTPRLNSLRRQAKKAESRAEVEAELRTKQISWFGFQDRELQEKKSEFSITREEQTRLLDEIHRELESTQRHLLAQSKAEGANLIEQLRRDLLQKQNERSSVTQALATVRGRRQAIDVSQAPINQQAALEEQHLLEADLSRLRTDTQALDQQLQAAQAELVSLEKEEQRFIEERHRLDQVISTLRTQNKQEAFELPRFRKYFERFTTALDILLTEVLSASIDDLPRLQDLARTAREELATVSLALSGEDQGARMQELLQAQDHLTSLLRERSDQMQQLAETRSRVASLEGQLTRLASDLKHRDIRLAEIHDRLAAAKISPSDTGAPVPSSLLQEEQRLEGDLDLLEKELLRMEQQLSNALSSDRELRIVRERLEGQIATLQNRMQREQARLSDVDIELARVSVRAEELERHIAEEMHGISLEEFRARAAEALAQSTPESREQDRHEMDSLKAKLEMIGGIDPEIVAEYGETEERHTFLTTQLEDLTTASRNLHSVIGELDTIIAKQFHAAFDKINDEFDRMFKVLFNGGTAKLVLHKPEEPELAPSEGIEVEGDVEEEIEEAFPSLAPKSNLEGVEIRAIPPGKKVTSLSMLSGGEKAMTSIALISAIIAANPSPFIVLDEVDAALDEANSRRYARIVSQLSEHTQFITITHNRETMRNSSILYGVTMDTAGISKILSIRLADAEQVAKQ